MPAGAVKVDRTTRWGNPFDFRAPDHCWTALALGCRGDKAGRIEASVKAYRAWIDPPDGKRTVSTEFQVVMTASAVLDGDRGSVPVGPKVSAGMAPALAEIREHLRGKSLACWCAPGAPCHADVLLELANG